MTSEELLRVLQAAGRVGQVEHTEFAAYITIIVNRKKNERSQWVEVQVPYMSVDGRVAMANEDHRRQGKRLDFEDPVVLVDDENQVTLLVGVTSEVYGRRHGIASSRKLTGSSAEKSNPWEVAETSAIGRALGAFGYGVLPGSGLASAEDIERLLAGDELAVEPTPANGRQAGNGQRSAPANGQAANGQRKMTPAEAWDGWSRGTNLARQIGMEVESLDGALSPEQVKIECVHLAEKIKDYVYNAHKRAAEAGFQHLPELPGDDESPAKWVEYGKTVLGMAPVPAH